MCLPLAVIRNLPRYPFVLNKSLPLLYSSSKAEVLSREPYQDIYLLPVASRYLIESSAVWSLKGRYFAGGLVLVLYMSRYTE